jgi:hypothetical protein
LQSFGIVFGYNRIVIYIEPSLSDDAEVGSNTARSNLLFNGEPLPWADWAEEFRERMPQEIRDHMESVASASKLNAHNDSIKERLPQIQELYKLSRYRPTKDGSLSIDPATSVAGGVPDDREGGSKSHQKTRSGSRGGKTGNVYSLFLSDSGLPGEETRPDPFPKVRWISVSDRTREIGDQEDRAARYLESENLLLINADFRVFTDMIDRWIKQYSDTTGAKTTIEEVVREWFEQSLVEAVMSSNALRDAQQWNLDHIRNLLSEEGLTAAVLPRWHIEQSIRRTLGTRLGSLKSKPA